MSCLSDTPGLHFSACWEHLAIVAKMLEEEEETRREGKRINVIDPLKTWREKFWSNCPWLGWGAAHHDQARAAARHQNAQGYSSRRPEERRGKERRENTTR